MASSTKWRVLSLANRTSQTGIDEIEMAAAAGGANLCTGGTAIASGTYGGSYSPSGAFDGSYASSPCWFQSGGGAGPWLGYEFASAVTVKEMRVVRAGQDPPATPRFMAFQYYDTTISDWVTDWYGFYDGWSDATPIAFPKPVLKPTYRYWGIANNNGAGGQRDTVIAEMELHATVGGADLTAPGGAVRGFPVDGGSPAANMVANDGETSIFYSNSNSTSTFVDYDFGAATEIVEYRFVWQAANAVRAPGTGHLIASDNGRSYLPIAPYTATIGDYSAGAITFGFDEIPEPPPVQPSRWRVKIDSVTNHGRNCVVAAEIQFLATRGGVDLVPTQTGYSSQLIYGNDGYGAAWMAFDDNAGSFWHDNCGLGGVDYIGWDFLTPTTVNGFSYKARPDGYGEQDSIETGGLEYFDDNTGSWVRTFSIPTQTGWGNAEYRAFFDPATAVPDADGYRFWEVTGVTGGDGSYSGFSHAEMSRLGEDNIALLSYIGTQRGGSFQAGSIPSLFREDITGYAQWNGSAENPAGGTKWFAVDFGENNQKKIRQITLLPNTDTPARSWTVFDIAVWNNPDRSDRAVLQRFATTWVANIEQTFTLDDYGTIAPIETVGSASGTSTALGYYIAPGTTEGHATGTGTANAASFSIGTIGRAGLATGLGAAVGVADPIRRTGGSAVGTSTVTGIGAAVGTISTVGTAAGTSTADSGSAATGILSIPGTAVGTSNALGVGTGRQSYVGTAVGTSTADGVGSYAPTLSVGRADGTSSVLGVGSGTRTIVGTASGRGDALGFMAGVRGMVGASAGFGTSSGISDQNRPFDGASAASSNALGVGSGLNSAVGSSVATSSADAVGTYAPTGGVGISTGGSTAIGRSSILRITVGAANATSGADGRSNSLAPVVGSSTGSSTSIGASRALLPMRGSAGGALVGDGRSIALRISLGRAAGTSTASGVSDALSADLDPTDLVLMQADDWLVGTTVPGDTMVIVAADDEIVLVPFDGSVALAA